MNDLSDNNCWGFQTQVKTTLYQGHANAASFCNQGTHANAFIAKGKASNMETEQIKLTAKSMPSGTRRSKLTDSELSDRMFEGFVDFF